MKQVLIIKTSSLGDIIHTLPALTDALKALGDIQFDWVVEENFAQIPGWHPAVRTVIPVAIRRWRKSPFKSLFSGEWQGFKKHLQQQQYDYIIDAQGLLKSAFLSHFTKGPVYGLDKSSAREPLAAKFYQYPLNIPQEQHAVERVRQLFAKVLGYELSPLIDYGIKEGIKEAIKENFAIQVKAKQATKEHTAPEILFFHGTTWPTKHWPQQYWQALADSLIQDGYEILIPWGSAAERQRANMLKEQASQSQAIRVLPKMSLREIAQQLSLVAGVVSVDTGLAHLAAALDIPQISLFGPTDPALTRPYGHHQRYLQVEMACKACMQKTCHKTQPAATENSSVKPVCYNTLQPEQVQQALYQQMGK